MLLLSNLLHGILQIQELDFKMESGKKGKFKIYHRSKLCDKGFFVVEGLSHIFYNLRFQVNWNFSTSLKNQPTASSSERRKRDEIIFNCPSCKKRKEKRKQTKQNARKNEAQTNHFPCTSSKSCQRAPDNTRHSNGHVIFDSSFQFNDDSSLLIQQTSPKCIGYHLNRLF